MTNEIISERLRELVDGLPHGKKSVVVLKGIPLNFVGESADLDDLTKNPLDYFLRWMNGGRKFLSHEEFLLLNAVIQMQYNAVYVLSNNLFDEICPIEENFSAATKKLLLEYFAEPATDDPPDEKNLGDAQKIADIFAELNDENFLAGICDDEEILNDPKVTVLNLFAPVDVKLAEVDSPAAQIFDLQDESDFVSLVQKIISAPPEKIFVRTQNFSGNKSSLDVRLKILHEYFSAMTKIFRVRPQKILSAVVSRKPRFAEILKRFWDCSTFRTFKIYDTEHLDTGEKIVRDVSQEQIISDIVRQVELCRTGQNFRDVFVTAPTGAGKSLLFQIPAIYLAERFKLLTIVVSPLIALMNDHVINLGLKNFDGVQTINSETPPGKREEIIEKISSGACNLLYVSPETLVNRTGVEQLIGDRTIGLFVVDEAHIVTTWGKQFRPDYWYLGDYVRRLRKIQRGHSFVVAAFTATAIYHGLDDMYDETLNALHMADPITYLGRVRRDDIEIKIDQQPLPAGVKLEEAKFAELLNVVKRAKIFGQKTLIYFPFVRLVEDAKYFLRAHGEEVEIYHGQLDKDKKHSAYDNFRDGKSLVMLATKAFGMGIDISDIKTVWHFATPAGVCDYVQEIGRAARAKDFSGAACYHYDKRDFKYAKTLHRLSVIKKYQLIEMLKKIRALYYQSRSKKFLLIDAENFSYLFDSTEDETKRVAKVKLALLTVQKDFELRTGFAPIRVRPCPLYSKGFFKLSAATKKFLVHNYGNCVETIDGAANIFSVNLKTIWDKNFADRTFPQFKYLIYSASDELPAELRKLQSALRVTVEYKKNFRDVFEKFWSKFKAVVEQGIREEKIFSVDELRARLFGEKIPEYKARNICEVLLAAADSYNKNFYSGAAQMFMKHFGGAGFGYRFNNAIKNFFKWVEKIFAELINAGDEFFVTDEPG
ncbi:MAG: ATP-dependent DNA helicase RecQ, partial [Selenomonadaceae bacterium]|nr:ATP-dependent DNA helicase RecQ [Selenomonadaceae bacterium]